MSSSSSTMRPREGWRCFMRRLLLLLDAILVASLAGLRAELAGLPRRDARRAEILATMGREAHRRSLANFDADLVNSKLVEEYRRMLSLK